MEDVDGGALPENKIDVKELERKMLMQRLYDAIDFCMIKLLIKESKKLRVDMFKAMAYISTSYNTTR